ncbi:hypothetical protein EMIT0P176_20255 [Pseudomonas sp. IT-P176]
MSQDFKGYKHAFIFLRHLKASVSLFLFCA